MMEKLLEQAKKVCDKAEVYALDISNHVVNFEDAKLHDIDSKFQSGVSLRIIKDGKLGFAYTRNLIDREELINNALESLKGGVVAEYAFPLTGKINQLDTYDSEIENISGADMVAECNRVCDILRSKTDGEIIMGTSVETENVRILNSEGTDVSGRNGYFFAIAYIGYPGSGGGLWRANIGKKFTEYPQRMVDELMEFYTKSTKAVEPKGGRMKVLFMPNCMETFNWRLLSGTSGKSVYEKSSPIADKRGEKIVSEKITFSNNPLDDNIPGARAFDDEGVACRDFNAIENGVLKSFYYDLEYAHKLKAEPTGHGYRNSMWGGDPMILKPRPSMVHLRFKPGDKSLQQLITSIDRGVIIEGALGPHSGNIPNGDFSIGTSPGLYVENGEIIGRVKGAMVSGNVYETLSDVIDVGDTLYTYHFGGNVPPILCDNISVATKS
jgi:PmbA protein